MVNQIGKEWHAAITAMWRKPGAIVLQLALPAAVKSAGYGAPPLIWLIVTSPQPSDNNGLVDIELVWSGKPPARLYEGIYFEMAPALKKLHVVGRLAGSSGGSGNISTGWKLMVDKLGSQIDAADVVTHGGSAVHGMDPGGGVTFLASADANAVSFLSLHIDSLDAVRQPPCHHKLLNAAGIAFEAG